MTIQFVKSGIEIVSLLGESRILILETLFDANNPIANLDIPPKILQKNRVVEPIAEMEIANDRMLGPRTVEPFASSRITVESR